MQYVWATILSTLPAIKLHFLAVSAFTIAELLIPAKRKQFFREFSPNTQHVLLYFFLTPFAMIIPSALVVSFTRQFGPGLISLDLNGFEMGPGSIAWLMRNILLPFVPM